MSVKVNRPYCEIERSIRFWMMGAQQGTLHGRLCFSRQDPCAAWLVFQEGDRLIEWAFGLDLLIAGQDSRTGGGDVQVGPIYKNGLKRILVTLSSPDGECTLCTTTISVSDFLDKVEAEMPQVEREAALGIWSAMTAARLVPGQRGR